MPQMKMSIETTPERAAQFANALAEDDAFRQRLQDSPREALEEYGIKVPPGQVRDQVQLPPKEKFRKAIDEARGDEEAAWFFIAFISFAAFMA